jgi:ribose 5-phosphate isomerase B
MLVGVAADHGGYELKKALLPLLSEAGHQVRDFGAARLEPGDDYPHYVAPLAQAVAHGEVERGIAVCGSGVGACIAANKIKGVRAALIVDAFSAHQGVEDDQMNLICLGGRVVGPSLAWELTRIFLAARPKSEERFLRRLGQVKRMEEGEAV